MTCAMYLDFGGTAMSLSIKSIRSRAFFPISLPCMEGDYVVSGPVWEYYDGPGWESGLRQELEDDRLCGFVGKTVIHPKQIELVNEAYIGYHGKILTTPGKSWGGMRTPISGGGKLRQ